MKKMISAVALTVTSSSALAGDRPSGLEPPMDNSWVLAAGNPLMKVYAKLGSGKFAETTKQEQVYVLRLRDVRQDGSSTTSDRYVKLDDCRAKRGQLVTLKPSGEVQMAYDFDLKRNDTLTDKVSEVICKVALEHARKNAGLSGVTDRDLQK